MLTKKITVLPHPPEFLSCYKDKGEWTKDSETYQSYKKELEKLLSDKPSTIVIIQSHGGIHPEGVTFQVPEGPEYEASFFEYGSPEGNFRCFFDKSLAHYIQKSLHEYGRHTHLISTNSLALPALLLVDMIKRLGYVVPRIVVVGVSLEGSQAHYEYGSLISRAIAADKDPIGVVISGQLSHTLNKDSVAGYVPIAQNYDEQIQKYLHAGNWQSYMNVDPFEIQEVGEDLYKPLSMGLGISNALEKDVQWEKTSYEAPHGIGYLCGNLSAA